MCQMPDRARDRVSHEPVEFPAAAFRSSPWSNAPHSNALPAGLRAEDRGPVSLPGSGRIVYWTGRVAIGLLYKSTLECALPPHSTLWVQELFLRSRAKAAGGTSVPNDKAQVSARPEENSGERHRRHERWIKTTLMTAALAAVRVKTILLRALYPPIKARRCDEKSCPCRDEAASQARCGRAAEGSMPELRAPAAHRAAKASTAMGNATCARASSGPVVIPVS